uniref:Uncharacterized protein n=1 Tax=Lepeophtheirus salmonis TaxID=72036 RepID=A0A0K2VA28_LEPSM
MTIRRLWSLTSSLDSLYPKSLLSTINFQFLFGVLADFLSLYWGLPPV